MKKPAAGMPITVPIDGKEYRLRYSLRALKTLEKEHGLSLMRGGEDMARALQSPSCFTTVLHVGLQAEHPDLTLEWVEDRVDAGMLIEIIPLLILAISGIWIGDKLEDAVKSPNGLPEVPILPSGTGFPSGPSADTTSVSVKPNSGT
jgi:hypothetical protein